MVEDGGIENEEEEEEEEEEGELEGKNVRIDAGLTKEVTP